MKVNVSALETALTALKGKYDEVTKINQGQRAHPDLGREQEDVGRKLDQLRRTTPDSGAATLKEKVSELPPMINEATSAMEGFRNSIGQAIAAMNQLALASSDVPPPGEGMMASKGGMAFLAGGGRPRGTDVIPAWLSSGEMVMSAGTTRKFASQLTAMNAGVKPSYHHQGGNITNIGDINVKVEGGSSGRQTARSIATELRRELRRGTSTL